MNNAGSCVQILTLGSKGNTGKFTLGIFPLQHTAWIQHGHMGTEGTGHPFNNAVLSYHSPLGVQVHHISGPVFNGRIAKSCPVIDKQLHTAGMQIGYIIFWSAAALNEMEAGVLFHNNKSMLKLPCSCGI